MRIFKSFLETLALVVMSNRYQTRRYMSVPEMLALIPMPNRQGCINLYEANLKLFQTVQGATNNHQAWLGGYHDHVQEVMNIVAGLYEFYKSLGRPLPFQLEDALLVTFLHDIEKPWKYDIDDQGVLHIKPELEDKEAQHAFRAKRLAEYNIILNPMQLNALRYVEGELYDYSSRHRVMNELASICHQADVASARMYYDYPLVANDPWKGARRERS